MEENISSNARPKYIKLLKTVESDWIKLQKDIMKTKKVSHFNLNIAACKLRYKLQILPHVDDG